MKITNIWLLIMTVGFFVTQAKATPTMGAVWNFGGNSSSQWSAVDYSSPGLSPTVGGSGQSVTLEFGTGGLAPAATLSTVGAAYTENYASFNDPNLALRFTFNPVNVDPAENLVLYFVSGGNTWRANNLNTLSTPGLQTYTVNIGLESYWTHTVGSGVTWSTGFGNIQEIGFYVVGPNLESIQQYTFSDISLTSQSMAVPEPETIWMIFMVLASLSLTFRSRLSGLAAQVKMQIKA
ncbi:MAG: hypothetical protein WCI03_01425 [bacterium]